MKITRIEIIMASFLLGMIFSLGLRAQSYSKPELYVKTGHIAPVYSVAISPNGELLVSAGSDGNIKLWNIETGQEIRNLASLPTFIEQLAFSPDSKTLACISGGFLTLWDIATGKGVIPLKDGVLDYDELIRNQGRKEFYEVLSKRRFLVSSVAFNPKKKNILAIGSDDIIVLWDFFAGKSIKSLQVNSQAGHEVQIKALAFNPSGKILVSGGSHNIVLEDSQSDLQTVPLFQEENSFGDLRLWNSETGKEIKTLSDRSKPVLNSVSTIALSPNGKTLVVADDEKLRRWDIVTGQELKPLAPSDKLKVNNLESIAFSPDGKIILSGSMSGIIKVWDAATRKELESLDGHKGSVRTIAFSSNGKIFASGGIDGTIKLWNGNTRQEIAELSKRIGFYPYGFAPNSVKLICLSGKTILLWNLATGQEFQLLNSHTDTVTSIAFTANGKTLASGSEDKTVKLWDLSTGRELTQFDSSSGHVTTVAISGDGNTLAAGSLDSTGGFAETSTITLWDVKSKQELWSVKIRPTTGNSSFIKSMVFSSDNQKLAFSEYGVVKLLDVKTGKELKSLAGKSNSAYPIEFSPDCNTIVIYESNTSIVKQWDVNSGVELPLPEETPLWFKQKFIRQINGSNITLKMPLTGISDNTKLTLLDANTNKEIASLVVLNEKDWLAVTPDGLFDGTPAAWKQIIWRFNNDTFDYAPVEVFFNEFFRPGLLKEIIDGNSPVSPNDFASLDRRQPQVKIKLVGAPSKIKGQLTQPVQNIQVEVTEAPSQDVRKATGKTNPQPAGDVRDVRLFRNGALVKFWKGDSIEKLRQNGCKVLGTENNGRKIICRTEVTIVAGQNTLTTYAFNRHNIKSNDYQMTITGAESIRRKGTLYILAIGINDYLPAGKSGNDLNFAVADAESISRELDVEQDLLAQEQKRYSKTEVIKLTDPNATKSNIVTALQLFNKNGSDQIIQEDSNSELQKIKPARPEDALVIYFAGHGTARCVSGKQEKQEKLVKCDRFYLIPQDGFPQDGYGDEKTRLARLYDRSLSDEELEDLLENVDAGKLLMVVDACNSGQALEAQEKRRGPMNSRGLAQLAYEKGMYILTATQSDRAALEVFRTMKGRDIKHGLLTYSLLQAMRDKTANTDGDTQLVDHEWFEYSVRMVPRLQYEEMIEPFIARDVGIAFTFGDDENLPPEKRGLQSPRLFYRRELELVPFIVSNF